MHPTGRRLQGDLKAALSERLATAGRHQESERQYRMAELVSTYLTADRAPTNEQ